MAGIIIELPPHDHQREFNLRRWAEMCEDRELAKFKGRIQMNRFGNAVYTPPQPVLHGYFQTQIGIHLMDLLPGRSAMASCPFSTADGVKVADVAWASRKRFKELVGFMCFPNAPEICVEVISLGNSEKEIAEKTALYFDAGAKEVWTCSTVGIVRFFGKGGEELKTSTLCPQFPKKLKRMA